jgi:hypothetical protein
MHLEYLLLNILQVILSNAVRIDPKVLVSEFHGSFEWNLISTVAVLWASLPDHSAGSKPYMLLFGPKCSSMQSTAYAALTILRPGQAIDRPNWKSRLGNLREVGQNTAGQIRPQSLPLA